MNRTRLKMVAAMLVSIVVAGSAVAARKPRAPVIASSSQRIERAVNQLLAQSDVFWHRGDYESVRACYAIITDLDPKYVEGWQDYGWLLWSGLNRDDAAMRVFQRGLAFNPDTYELYFEIANLEYHKRRFLSAAQWLAKATARNAPQMVWHMRAHCLEYAGEIGKAKAMWRTIMRKYPKDPPAPVNLKRLEEGRIHLNPVIGVEAPKEREAPPTVEQAHPVAPVDPNSI